MFPAGPHSQSPTRTTFLCTWPNPHARSNVLSSGQTPLKTLEVQGVASSPGRQALAPQGTGHGSDRRPQRPVSRRPCVAPRSLCGCGQAWGGRKPPRQMCNSVEDPGHTGKFRGAIESRSPLFGHREITRESTARACLLRKWGFGCAGTSAVLGAGAGRPPSFRTAEQPTLPPATAPRSPRPRPGCLPWSPSR